MEAVIFDGKGAVPTFNQGVSQAVTQGAAGIVLLGVPPAAVQAPLAEATAAKIPVVDIFNGSADDPLEAGIFAHVTADFVGSGKDLADWMLADSDCKVNVEILGASVLATQTDIIEGAEAQLKAECPDCTSNASDVDLSSVAVDIAGKVETALRRNPDLNYIFPVFDSAVTFVAPAVAQSGADVKIISHDGVSGNLDDVRGRRRPVRGHGVRVARLDGMGACGPARSCPGRQAERRAHDPDPPH